MQSVPAFVVDRLAGLQKRAAVAREQARSTQRRVEDAKHNARRAEELGMLTVAEASAREAISLETTLRAERLAAEDAQFFHAQAANWLHDLPEGTLLVPASSSGTDPASLLGCSPARAA